MRLVVAQMKHETNTFSPIPTPLEAFGPKGGPYRGRDVIDAFRGTNTPIAAFIDAAIEEEAELVTPLAANAVPSGPVDADAHAAMVEAICHSVQAGCDAVLLDLHGAMVVENSDDGEGALLRRIREIAPEVPIAVALDFHTNMSADMVENATVITGYRTYPHVDTYDTGRRAARTLIHAIRGECHPVMVWGNRPMLTHMLRQTPARQPMKDVMDRAIAAEDGGIVLNASVFGGFPLADIPHAALSAVVVADGDRDQAQELCEGLLDMAWERRADFVYAVEPMSESIARARTLDGGPVVLVDHGDNAFAGGCQDVMAVVQEVMRQGLEGVAVGPIWDPASVARMIAAGVGATVTLALGGKTDMPALGLKGEPLDVTGVVRAITDGSWMVTGPMMTGTRATIGRTAVLDTGPMQIVVSERRLEPFDLGILTHCGIDVRNKRFLLIKSRQHYRAGFEPIAKHIVEVAGPGVCTSDYGLLRFKNVRRPIYPLDPDMML